ncbi:MAG TPA: transglutaminase-like domain-containing protein [Sedimentisphaerales bacterium]|nr:transglutaminase-like domain-containing protein [Sedimentisphaerales bacterium]
MKYLFLLGMCSLLVMAGLPELAIGQTEYFAVFMEGKKVGHAIQSRTVAEGKVTTTEEVSITISRLDIPITVKMTETGIETVDGKPLAFESLQDLGLMAMKVSGTIDEQGKVNVKVMSMGGEQQSTIDWPSGAIMAEGLRLLEMQKGLKEGTEYTAKVFSPGILGSVDVKISIGPKRNVDLLGRVVSLTEVKTTTKVPLQNLSVLGQPAGENTGERIPDEKVPQFYDIVSTGYVDENLRLQKNITPVMDFEVEMVACTKEFALGENDVLELVSKMFLPSPQPLDNIDSAKAAIYHLQPVAGANDLKIPVTDNQQVRSEAGRVIVTVRPVAAPAGARFPYKGKDPAILEAMKPTRFVQSDNKEIIRLARQAVGGTRDAGEAAKKIEAFVAGYVENKSLSVGYASAAEVAASRQGDCSEFAVLTAALCRAVGIPAQVVVGVAYVNWDPMMRRIINPQGADTANAEHVFGGHAWVQACVGDKWVGLDAAFKSAGLGGYDPGHIALAVGNGDPEDFFNLLGTIGQFKIEKVVVGN